MSGLDATGARDAYHRNVRLDVVPYVPYTPGTLLDVGGGVGATAAELKRLGSARRVGVVDIVGGVSDVDFAYCGDIESESFMSDIVSSEGPFGTVLCLDVLEHIVDPWRLVRQLHQALAPGGVIVASIPNIRYFRALFPLFFLNRWTLRDSGVLDRTHLRFFVRSTAIELMTHSGLALEKVVASPDGRKLVAILRRLTFGLLNTFTDRQYIIRVRRID